MGGWKNRGSTDGQSHGSKLVSPKFWGHEDMSTAVLSSDAKSGDDGHGASRGSEPVWENLWRNI